jgi:hypothetical protein
LIPGRLVELFYSFREKIEKSTKSAGQGLAFWFSCRSCADRESAWLFFGFGTVNGLTVRLVFSGPVGFFCLPGCFPPRSIVQDLLFFSKEWF